jgi:hypothetical protein
LDGYLQRALAPFIRVEKFGFGPYNIKLKGVWGRTGFDEGNETQVARRGPTHLAKLVENNLTAEPLAVAA